MDCATLSIRITPADLKGILAWVTAIRPTTRRIEQDGQRVKTHERDYDIAVLSRALDLIDALAGASEPIGASEIARQLGATKSATYRILVNLERRGYVRKDAATARYLLGPRLVALGHRASGELDLVALARPRLEALSASLQETANLGVMQDGDIVYLDIVESPRNLRMAARVGARDCVHSTALGKAILAFLPAEERDACLARPLPVRTELTITDPEQLQAEIERIRRSGVATESGENEPDARCIGVPVFDHHGNACAAISISGPASRLDDENMQRAAGALLREARALTADLGGLWPSLGGGD